MSADRPLAGFSSPRFVLGLTAIGVGFLFLAHTLRWFHVPPVIVWWPIVVVAVGAAKLLGRETGTGLAWTGVGGLLLLNNMIWIPLGIWDALFPTALVAIGVTLVLRAVRGPLLPDGRIDSTMQAIAILGGASRTSRSPALRGGDAVAVMGAAQVDLRGAALAPEGAVIDVLAFWGGIEILVPRGWQIDCRVVSLLGATEDKTRGEGAVQSPGSPDGERDASGDYTPPQGSVLVGGEPGGPRLVLRGLVLMGGVEIRHESRRH